ncbi:MAG: lysine exporter LysO family protein [Firmicutes bacterium]|nr:lysine exporter LysO family protein [Bacillota bacterium]
MDLLLLYGSSMLAGYFAASKLRNYSEKFGFVNYILNCVVVGVIFLMGLRMGANEEIISQLGTIGVQSAAITVFAVGGSIFFVSIARRIMGLDRYGHMKAASISASANPPGAADVCRQEESKEEPEKTENVWAFTVAILIFAAVGMVVGYLVVLRCVEDIEGLNSVAGNMIVGGVCILLLIIGFNMGLTGQIVSSLKSAGLRIFIIPFAAILGSIVFGGLYGLISPLTVREGMAISAGFGWYTFAPSVIIDSGHVVAGAVSFMHNVLRETLGIVSIPIAAKLFGYIESTSVAGVAAMDVCMPITEKACNEETAIYSFATGVTMSITIPIIVPLLIG